MKQLMYIENKSGGLNGPGRIGWVELSKSMRSYHYGGRTLKNCPGYKYNCIDMGTGEHFWISRPKQDGSDRLYGGMVEIDDDATDEYWMHLRKCPSNSKLRSFRVRGRA